MGEVFIATIAVGDDRNDQGTEIVGVFSTLDAAWKAAIAEGEITAAVTRYRVDAGEPYSGELVRWREWDGVKKCLATRNAEDAR